MTMKDDTHRHALTGIQKLEHELIVRDFVSVLNEGRSLDVAAFLHPDVVYRASTTQGICGRRNVLTMCQDIRDAFDEVHVDLIHVAVTDEVVLAEQSITLQLRGGAPVQLLSFASFRMDGFRIIGWQQLHA